MCSYEVRFLKVVSVLFEADHDDVDDWLTGRSCTSGEEIWVLILDSRQLFDLFFMGPRGTAPLAFVVNVTERLECRDAVESIGCIAANGLLSVD